MRYTKVDPNAFKKLQLNAGILLDKFTPEAPNIQDADFLGATSGGVNFNAVPEFIDFGEDIDNCPKNTKELKQIDAWDIKMSGDFASADGKLVKMLVAAADVAGNKVTPRIDLKDTDFTDIWWVGDYGEDNTDEKGTMIAIHMMDALSTSGFTLQTADKEKGKFTFEFTAHTSMKTQNIVPFEIYISEVGAGA